MIDISRYVDISTDGPGQLQRVSIHRHGSRGYSVGIQSYVGSYVGFDVHLSRDQLAALHVAIGEVLAKEDVAPCGALRGMESYSPSCDLPSDHAGTHRWTGPSTDEKCIAVADSVRP
jgi:hypothetical protein